MGEVGAVAVGPLADLGAAAEAVGQDDRVRCGGTHGGQQGLLACRDGHVVVATLEAEVPRQTATAGIQHAVVDPHRRQQRTVGGEAARDVLVAVGLAEGPGVDARRLPAGGVMEEEFGEGAGGCGERTRIGVAVQELSP